MEHEQELPVVDQAIEQVAAGSIVKPIPEAISGVGRLAEVIGVHEAEAWFKERQERREFLYTRALKRWGRPQNRLPRHRSR